MALQYIILLLLFGSASVQSDSILLNGCPADFHIHRLLPHETDCSQFYQCSNGLRVLMHCAPGTLFSEELQGCNWPYAVECHSTTTKQTVAPTTEGSTTYKLTTESDEETTVKPSTIEEITEENTETAVVEQTTTDPIATLDSEPPYVSEEENPKSSETEQNTSSDNLPNGCPTDFSIHILLPHESDCDKFYQCSNGIKYLMQCGAGTLFDSEIQVCNWPDAVECQPTTTKPTVKPITESTTSKVTTEESDEDTSIKPTTIEEITEQQSTVDNADQTTIDSIMTTTEESTMKPTTAPSSTGTIPDETTHSPESTTRDFTITSQSPNSTTEEIATVTQNSNYTVDEYTTATQSFNYTTEDYATATERLNSTTEEHISETQNSNYTTEEYVTVTQSSNYTTEEYATETLSSNSTTGDYDTTTESYNSTIEDIGSSTNSTMVTQNPGNSTTQEFTTVTESWNSTTDEPIITTEAPICPAGVFGNVPHPNRCDAFYLCSGGLAFEVTCASGYEFDPVANVCVEIAEGGCTLGYTDNENSNYTTTEFPTNMENATDGVTQEVSKTTVQDFTTKPDYETVTDEIKEETMTAELLTDYPGIQESTTQKYTTDEDVDEVTKDSIDVTNTDGLSNNNSTEVTDSWINGNMTDGTMITQNPDNSTTQESTTVTESWNLTTGEPSITTEAPICPAGVFGNVPHPNRCDAFYLCSGGLAFEVTCASGYEFDPVAKQCVTISEGGCTLGKITTVDPDSSVSTEAENITVSNTTTEANAINATTEGVWDLGNPTTERVNETTTLTDTELLTTQGSDSHNATSNIDENVLTTQKYELTTEYSENNTTLKEITEESVSTETTDYSNWDNANVTITLAPPQSPNITTDEPTDNSIETTEEDTIDAQEPICSPGVFGNVPHPDRCDAFYICSGGFSFEVFCSSGFEFDAKSQECVQISQGGCTLGPVTTEENTKQSTTTVTDTNTETITESYNEAEVTDAEMEITDAPWNLPPPNIPVPIPPPSANPDVDPICPAGVFGNIPHHSRCDAYYLCSAGMAFEMLCPSGFEFDLNTKNCAEIAEGGCTLSTNHFALKISPVHTRNNGNSKVEHNNEDRKENMCTQNFIGNMPHEELCNSFYKCMEGEKIQLFCSGGFEFEPRLKKCVPLTDTGCTSYKKMPLQ